MLVSLKDSLLVVLPAILSDSVGNMTLGGLLYAGYAILTMIALPYTDNSSNVIDVILSFPIPFHTLMTTSLGSANSDADFDGGTDSQLTAQAPWILSASVLDSAAALLLTL